jgi:hypothetical protein
MLNQEDAEERAERLAQEKRDLDDAHNELVKCVLSNTRIDPKYKGKEVEFFQAHEADATPEQVKALTQGKYYGAFKYFYSEWKKPPADNKRPELYTVVEAFTRLSKSTISMFREIQHQENEKKRALTDVEILKSATFLSQHIWSDNASGFNVDDLAEALNDYIDLNFDLPFVDRSLLKLSVTRAYDEQKIKATDASETIAEKWFGKLTYTSIFATVIFKIIGYLICIAIYLAIDVWIVFASVNHLSGENFPYWSWIGLGYVAVTGIITLIHLGTYGTRNALEALARPKMSSSASNPSVNVDLWAMNKAVAAYRSGHINLRLVREQLVRLQNTDIQFPVQLLTLIDRSIAKGIHHW